MAEHGHPGLGPGEVGDRLGKGGSDPAIALLAAGVLAVHIVTGGIAHRFGDDDQREIASASPQPVNMCRHDLDAR